MGCFWRLGIRIYWRSLLWLAKEYTILKPNLKLIRVCHLLSLRKASILHRRLIQKFSSQQSNLHPASQNMSRASCPQIYLLYRSQRSLKKWRSSSRADLVCLSHLLKCWGKLVDQSPRLFDRRCQNLFTPRSKYIRSEEHTSELQSPC